MPVTDEEIDELAVEVEQAIAETAAFLEEQPDYPPRPGKFERQNEIVDLEDAMNE